MENKIVTRANMKKILKIQPETSKEIKMMKNKTFYLLSQMKCILLTKNLQMKILKKKWAYAYRDKVAKLKAWEKKKKIKRNKMRNYLCKIKNIRNKH